MNAGWNAELIARILFSLPGFYRKPLFIPYFCVADPCRKTRGSFLTRPARAASSSSKLAHQECCYGPKNWIHHENLRIASSLKNSTFKQRNQLLWRREFFRRERDCSSKVQGPSRDFGRREVKTGPFTKLLFFTIVMKTLRGPWRPEYANEARSARKPEESVSPVALLSSRTALKLCRFQARYRGK